MKPERHWVRQPRTPRRRTERGRSRDQERISPQRGDTRAKLAAPLESVYDGSTVRIGVNNETLDVRIPKGRGRGQVIRLAGQGKHGDLLLEIEYAAHPQFEVDGRNIIYTLPVAPWEAALGATVSVPTLGDPVAEHSILEKPSPDR